MIQAPTDPRPSPPRSQLAARRGRSVGSALLAVSLSLGLGYGAHALAAPSSVDAVSGDAPVEALPTWRVEGDEAEPTKAEAKRAPPSIARVKVAERDGMLLIPGGRFPMGTNHPKAPPNERPQRLVTVGAFWLDRTEVTVGAYRACVDAKRCERPQPRSASCTYDLGDAELPISCVRWADAETFCKSLQKRLPSESEWEFAARGPEGSMFPWGNRGPDCKLANTLARDTSGRTCAARPWRVGSAPANASKYGVLDLGGNVEEWTADWYTERLGSGAPLSGASHALRGGGWQSTPTRSRTTTRDWGSALESGPNVGFRCAKDGPQQVAPVTPLAPPPRPRPAADPANRPLPVLRAWEPPPL